MAATVGQVKNITRNISTRKRRNAKALMRKTMTSWSLAMIRTRITEFRALCAIDFFKYPPLNKKIIFFQSNKHQEFVQQSRAWHIFLALKSSKISRAAEHTFVFKMYLLPLLFMKGFCRKPRKKNRHTRTTYLRRILPKILRYEY